MERPELRPCPFCGRPALWVMVGGRAVTTDLEVRDVRCWSVTCSDRDGVCPVVPRTNWFTSMGLAASEWNRRVS